MIILWKYRIGSVSVLLNRVQHIRSQLFVKDIVLPDSLQRALGIVQTWYGTKSLSFNPIKTEIGSFPIKYKRNVKKQIIFHG